MCHLTDSKTDKRRGPFHQVPEGAAVDVVEPPFRWLRILATQNVSPQC